MELGYVFRDLANPRLLRAGKSRAPRRGARVLGNAGAAEGVGEARGEAFEGGGAVHLAQANFDEAELLGVVLGGHEGFVELLFSLD
jgi:hypothetical protein